jgi:phosphonate utilization transcriptional regulator
MQSELTQRSSSAQAIGLLQEHSLATLAQHELGRRIVSGELAVGAKLNEVDIATELGISRGPVREAFRALDQAGLVRVEKNRGVFVRQVSLEEANEIYEVRAVLEGLIGRLAAQRIEADEIDQLRAIVKRMRAQEKGRNAQAYFPLNVEFHDLLARAARNGALLANYRGVVNQLDLYRRATLTRSTDNIPISTRDHEAIVVAVAARDASLAERLMSEHVLQSRQRLHRALGLHDARAS